MPNFAQNSVVMSSMATKKYIWAYFRRKSMDLGQKKYTSQIEVSRTTPEKCVVLKLKAQFQKLKNTY